MQNDIKTRRKALGLSQKKLAEMVAKAANESFSYQALQKVEDGGKTTFMHTLLEVLDREERKKILGPQDSEGGLSDTSLMGLAKKYRILLETIDALDTHRRKYILDETANQLAKQRDSPPEQQGGRSGAVTTGSKI